MQTTPGKQQSILVVDDTPANIEILSSVLGEEHDILFATSGEDALELAGSERPDLILLDIMMPGLDGYEVCKRLKRDECTKGIPVIFITAMSEEEDETYGLEVGAIDYISKPISAPIVRARVRNHLELKRYRDALERLSTTDALTGIPNRRRFDDFIEREWFRARRNQAPLAIIMMDVDHFKRYNDHYGHAAGDDCLRKVATALAGCVRRPADLVARYGGEEFVAVLPETHAAGAAFVASTMCLGVSGLQLPHAQSAAADHVTVSGGCVTMIPREGVTLAQHLGAADALLYAAKTAGRNRILSQEGL